MIQSIIEISFSDKINDVAIVDTFKWVFQRQNKGRSLAPGSHKPRDLGERRKAPS